MKTANIGELRNHLSGYLQHVREGGEVVVCDRNVPMARILPIPRDETWANEAELVATGKMTLPKQEMDWDRFFAIGPVGNVSQEIAVQAVIDSRGDR